MQQELLFKSAGRMLALVSALTMSLTAQSVPNTFLVHNFVSDLAGMADHQDPNLVNPWGNGFGATPFWIGNNGTGTSTLYDGTGTALSLVVDIPAPGGATTGGAVSGVIYNTFSSNTAAFAVAPGKPASFIFCTEDGLIAGWNSSVNSTEALVLLDNSASGAVYKACELGGTSTAPLLFAADFHNGLIDVYDGSMNLVQTTGAFTDAAIPAGFAPFSIVLIGGNVYVAYAKQDAEKHDDVAGPGNGYVVLFDQAGNLIATLISQGALNSPWGMALAPSTFGPFGGALLVGNFGDGKINAYDLATGDMLGTLNDVSGNPIAYPGLWSLNFGSGSRSEDPGTLYFTAGIGGGPNNDPVESHGLFGSIQPVPSFTAADVQNAGSYLPDIAANTWVALKGSALSALPVTWAVTGNPLPTTVGSVGVTVNGEAAPVSYASNMQINFLVPADIAPGPAQIQATNAGMTSASVTVTAQALAPSFFTIGTNTAGGYTYVAATHADNTLIGPPGLISGVTTTAAAPGETIVLYGTGFGQTNPAIPNGQLVPTALDLVDWPTVYVDAMQGEVTFAGLVGPGLYQVNVTLPASLTSGDHFIVALLGDSGTQPGAFITIAAQ